MIEQHAPAIAQAIIRFIEIGDQAGLKLCIEQAFTQQIDKGNQP
jgi:hypothetical protein